MSKTVYVTCSEINELQRQIMYFVDNYARTIKEPTPLKEIMKEMKKRGVKDSTIINAINSLLHKKYIRRAIVISNKTSFVQLRKA